MCMKRNCLMGIWLDPVRIIKQTITLLVSSTGKLALMHDSSKFKMFNRAYCILRNATHRNATNISGVVSKNPE